MADQPRSIMHVQPSDNLEATALAIAARIADDMAAPKPDVMRDKAKLVVELAGILMGRSGQVTAGEEPPSPSSRPRGRQN